MKSEVWIGLVCMKPRDENTILENSKGAYTSIVTMASSLKNYEEKVKELLNYYFLDLIEIEDAEPFEDRIAKYIVDQDLIDLAKSVMETGGIRFSTLNTY